MSRYKVHNLKENSRPGNWIKYWEDATNQKTGACHRVDCLTDHAPTINATPANINPTRAANACGAVENSQSNAFLSIIMSLLSTIDYNELLLAPSSPILFNLLQQLRPSIRYRHARHTFYLHHYSLTPLHAPDHARHVLKRAAHNLHALAFLPNDRLVVQKHHAVVSPRSHPHKVLHLPIRHCHNGVFTSGRMVHHIPQRLQHLVPPLQLAQPLLCRPHKNQVTDSRHQHPPQFHIPVILRFHHLIPHRHKVLDSQPVQLRLHLHLSLIRHPHRKPRLGVTTHPCVASRFTSRFFRRHHITLVFSRFMTSIFHYRCNVGAARFLAFQGTKIVKNFYFSSILCIF